MIINGGKVTAGSSTIDINGNWAYGGGTFVPNTSNIYLIGGNSAVVSGNTTFTNFGIDTTVSHLAKTVSFASGSTQTITGTLTLNGESGHILTPK